MSLGQDTGNAARPQPGTTIDASNLAVFAEYIGPSVRWAIERGLELEVVEPRSIPLEPARLAATEKYSAQVRLAADKLGIENYVAGLPFPMVDAADPDAAVKLMYNYENRPREVERNFVLGHFRRRY